MLYNTRHLSDVIPKIGFEPITSSYQEDALTIEQFWFSAKRRLKHNRPFSKGKNIVNPQYKGN